MGIKRRVESGGVVAYCGGIRYASFDYCGICATYFRENITILRGVCGGGVNFDFCRNDWLDSIDYASWAGVNYDVVGMVCGTQVYAAKINFNCDGNHVDDQPIIYD